MRGGSTRVIKDLGRRIAELRVARDWTQDDLSTRLNVSLKYLQRVEAGYENLTVDSLYKIAMKLRVDVADLFAPPTTREVRRGRPPRRRVEAD